VLCLNKEGHLRLLR
jgi:hypothetical protein